MKMCSMCNINEVLSNNGRYCKECGISQTKERQKEYKLRKKKEKEIEFNENFHQLDLVGLDLLPGKFNELSSILNTAYSTQLKMNWIEVLRHYNKEESLLGALVDEFGKYYRKTGSQSVKEFASYIGSSSSLFKHMDSSIFKNLIDEKELKSSSRSNITIEDIEERLSQYLEDITLISSIYVNAETPLLFKCLICNHGYSRKWKAIVSHQSGCPVCFKNGAKVSNIDIDVHVKKYDYRIISFIGGCADKGTVFNIECFRGHIYETNYREFNEQQSTKGGSCKKCIKEGYSVSRVEAKKELLNRLAPLGYTTEYEFNHTQEIMTFTCSEGHERVTTFNGIMNHPRCAGCHDFVVRHTEESVSRELSKIGLEYVGGWIDTKQYFTYKCSCGSIGEGMYFYLLEGARCFECSAKKHWKHKDVLKYFQDNGCELIEENYVGMHVPMEFRCSCQRVGSKTLGAFMYSPFCRECVVESIPTGKEHHNWNPDKTDEERVIERHYPEYNQWRKLVFERDNYACQCCGIGGGSLSAHHKDGYHWCKERRLDVTNGSTLCDSCHMTGDLAFHRMYGIRNNTENQFNEWLSIRTNAESH